MLGKKDIQSTLINAGISEGRNIILSVGNDVIFADIEDGEIGLFQSILKSVTYLGTIVLPTWSNFADPFDSNTVPCTINSFHETIRTFKEPSFRSLHPTHSATIFGQNLTLGAEHHLGFTPMDPKYSPYAKIIQKSMSVLVGIGNEFENPLGYLAEEIVGIDYNIDHQYKTFEVIGAKGERFKGFGFLYYSTPRYFHKLNEYMRYHKIMKTISVEGVSITVIEIEKYIQAATSALRADKTLFIKE